VHHFGLKIVRFPKSWWSPINRRGSNPSSFFKNNRLFMLINTWNLFINEVIFAATINAFPLIKEITQYCIDECSNLIMLLLLFLGFLLNTVLYSVTIYTLLFSIKWILQKKLSQYFHYPQYLNILIRILPFGYIFTSIITIARWNTYLKWLGKEIWYSIWITIIYILVTYFLYWNYLHTHY
jgi:ABC-type multidrug transport system fused ATPase/permease subunit